MSKRLTLTIQSSLPMAWRVLLALAPEHAGKVKIIGLGVGNSDYEIQVFREKYTIAFPLFPDKSFAIHKLLGEVRTPYFWVLRLDGQGGSRVIYSKLGGITDLPGFLKLIRQGLGLE
ncbi:MAG: hypothetical protein HQK58_13560 [Deltaproteobacteria bacterium]|nr:hypothetical protein [Deltaproteobacteria bacterium]